MSRSMPGPGERRLPPNQRVVNAKVDMTQVSEVMTRGVRSLSPQDPVATAARSMEALDVGAIPVCESQRLVGMVTDRDIVVRVLAEGLTPEVTSLGSMMSRQPQSCFDDDSVDQVLEQMRSSGIRRLPVLDRDEQLVGMLSLGDVAVKADSDGAGILLQEISEPVRQAGNDAGGGPGRGNMTGAAVAPGGASVRVADVMTRDVQALSPSAPVIDAARLMKALDIGVVPVVDGERLVGIATDRDIVVRGVAQGRPATDTPLGDIISRELRWCSPEQSIDEVLEQMRDARIRRVPVLDRAGRLVGMLTLGDVAARADGDGAGIVLGEVSEPARPDTSSGQDPDVNIGVASAGERARASGARKDDVGVERVDDRNAPPTWVLVADEALARLLERPHEGGDLESVEALTDSAAHDRESDQHRDAAGRRAGSAPQGSRQNTPHRLRGTASITASAGEDQQHLEAQGFARRVAQHLAEALQQRRFGRLHVVAAPRFLGYLRKELDPSVAATVVDEINKDLIHASNAELTRRLFDAPGAAAS